MKRSLVALCFLTVLCSCAAPRGGGRFEAPAIPSSNIRVLLDEGNTSLRVSASAGLMVRTSDGLKLLESAGVGAVVVTVSNPGLNLLLEPEQSVAAIDAEAVIVAKGGGALTYDGVPYAGEMRVALSDEGTLRLLNVLSLESYLEGVLPHEMGDPGAKGYDALKSQAVAARTYAYGKMIERRDGAFDVYASVRDQVYRGLKGKNRAASAAVRETRARILSFDGELVRAYYSACCGGHTSDIRKMWSQRQPADYLHGVTDRSRRETRAFCRDNRYFRWRYSFAGRELGEILRVTLPRELGVSKESVGALRDVRIDGRTNSGRVTSITFETTKGTFTVEADRIRWALMTDLSTGRILPSAMFRLDKVMEGDRIAFVSVVGGGNGHGVGMCQTGAIAMAKKGYTYEMILRHYYPGCTVGRAY